LFETLTTGGNPMPEEGFKRKLAAILSADVEGYSRLMDDDEEATVRTLTSYRTAITDLVQQYRGRVIDSPGDNILAEFASVVDSVNCGVEIQRELAERNAELPDERKMQFRIGVNLGDVIDEDGRIYGDGVNIAARVESLAEAGGICISGRAHDQVENKLGLEYEDLGKHEVKNISRPIQVYQVLSHPGAAAHRVVQAKEILGRRWRKFAISGAVVIAVVAALGIWQFYMRRPSVEPASVDKMAYPMPEKPSIAVLPFTNMSADSEQEYFSDGISEEIITALSSVPELFVIARNSSFTYKGKPVKVQQVSEELGVRYVLEGSVRKAANKVRITAQLIDAISGRHLWAESYDRTLEDIFALQDEITMKIITELQVELTGREGTRLRAPCSENLKAYLKYLEALGHFSLLTKEDNAAARRLVEEAIALDPGYACAYSLLGTTYYGDVLMGASTSPRDSIAKAKEMIDKAIALNPTLPGPHAMLSRVFVLTRQYEKAISTATKAIELGPNSVLAHYAMGSALRSVGKSEESISFLKQAVRLDPYSTIYLSSLGLSYFLIGQYDEAIHDCKKAANINPNNLYAHLCLASTYSAAGFEKEARVTAAEIHRINPRFSVALFSKMWSLQKADKELFADSLRKAGLK
jgi:TolB-like protein/class 3 adenylate cyclase/Flp pilus assembly protein TadD